MQGRSGFVTTDIVYLSAKTDIVATDSISAINSLCDLNSDCGDEYEKDNESL